MKSHLINTPIGEMLAVADDKALFYLNFLDCAQVPDCKVEQGENSVLRQLEEELCSYFSRKLRRFKTPLHFEGTDFQKQVWKVLYDQMPYGQKMTYKQQAEILSKPKAYRAVAQANGRNKHVIIVPCHRIIGCSGKLGGYSAGIERKKWLLAHEQEHSSA